MAFQFALQTLLQLREAIEERERMKLEACLRDMNQIQCALDRLRSNSRGRIADQQRALVSSGLAGSELHFGIECRYAESVAAEQMTQALLQAQKKCDSQRERYDAAHRSRELLQALRDQQREAFVREQSRREQNAADDLFLVRSYRNNRP